MTGNPNDFEQASDISGSVGKTAVNEKKDTSSSYSRIVDCDMNIINGKDVVYQIVDEEEMSNVVVAPEDVSELEKPYEESVSDLSAVTIPESPQINDAIDTTELATDTDVVKDSPLMLVAPMEKLEMSTCVGFSVSMKNGVHETFVSRCPILPDNTCPISLDTEKCVSTKINVDHLNISSFLKNM